MDVSVNKTLRHVWLNAQALVARNYPPPFFFNFLFTYLFSIKFLYIFIISSRFPYFNLFVSIFIQSYVNSNLHMSTQYIYELYINIYINYPQGKKLRECLEIVHLLASVAFNAPYFRYVIQTRTCINT